MPTSQSALRARLGTLLRPPSRRLLVALVAAHLAIGAWIVRGAHGSPALGWMEMYRFADFADFGDAWRFFAELRTGIPPWLAALEVTEYLLTGRVWWTDVVGYRAILMLAFVLPVVAFRRSRLQVLAAFALSLLFLASARIVGSPNPQIYDPLTPLLLIGGLLGIDAARRRPGAAFPLAALAGTSLALAELSRPFILLLLPLLLGWGWWVLRGLPRRCRLALLVPVLLLSGGWHAKLWLLHDGQLVWSNHGGFNLYRAWRTQVDRWPAYTREPDWATEPAPSPDEAFRGSGRLFHLRWNTQSHADRSRELTGTFLHHVAWHPLASARHAAWRVALLLGPRLTVAEGAPLGWLRLPYRLAVRATSLWLLAALLVWAVRLARRRREGALASLESAWIPTAGALIFFLAIGDRSEQARFVISVLPFLAALPWPAGAPGRSAESDGPAAEPPDA